MKVYSNHPYETFIPKNSTKLIIGTIPPYRFCTNEGKKNAELSLNDVDFYYGSHDNYFWELISNATNTELSFENSENAVKQRKELLCKLGIGITDIVERCIHNGGKSADNDLTDIIFRDIKSILNSENASDINTLIYTSELVKKLMNNIQDKSYHSCIDKAERKYQVSINGKTYNVIVLYSPSPMALRSVSAEKRMEQYIKVFG